MTPGRQCIYTMHNPKHIIIILLKYVQNEGKMQMQKNETQLKYAQHKSSSFEKRLILLYLYKIATHYSASVYRMYG